MDRYMKKPLRFCGLGRDVRVAELNAARRSSRIERFSLLRSIEDEVPKENIPGSKIPTIGKTKNQAFTRADMLKKWKEEKLFKQKVLKESVKPAFKTGIVPPKTQTGIASFDQSKRLGNLSKIQESCYQSFSYKPETNGSVLKNLQASKFKPATKTASGTRNKDIDWKPNNQRSQTVPVKPLASKVKADVCKPPSIGSHTATTKHVKSKIDSQNSKQDSALSHPLKAATTARFEPKINKNKDSQMSKPSFSFRYPKSATAVESEPKENKSKKSNPAASSLKPPKIISDVKECKKIPVSGLPKRTINPLPQWKQNLPSKLNKPGTKTSNPAQVIKPTAIRKPAEKPKMDTVQPKKVIEESSASQSQSSMFPCHISLIEPVKAEKSFAPESFVFCPPADLKTSWEMEDGAFAVFQRITNQEKENIRTSTPKRSEWEQCKEENNSSCIQKTPSTNDSPTKSEEESPSTIPSSETKYVDCLLDNSPSEMLKGQSPQKNEMLEQKQESEILVPEVNKGIGTDVHCLRTVPHEEISPENDSVEMAQTKPEDHLTNAASGLCFTEIDGAKRNSPDLCSKTGLDGTLLNIPDKDKTEPISPDICVAETGQGSILHAITEETQPDELDVFHSPPSLFRGLGRSRRFARRHEKSTLVKISESPEGRDTSKVSPKMNQRKVNPPEGFTPRRSTRLASRCNDTVENLFDVEPLFEDPDIESSRLSYDFDRLHLESVGEASAETPRRMSTRSSTVVRGKVSLLYTPPPRTRSKNKSVHGDLMSFTPNDKS